MFLPGAGEDDDVVEVVQTGLSCETIQDAIHEAGEGGRSVRQAEGDTVELEEAAVTGAEGGLGTILLSDGDLSIPILEVKGGEPAGPM